LEELIDFRSLAFERLIAFMEKEKQKKNKKIKKNIFGVGCFTAPDYHLFGWGKERIVRNCTP